MTPSLVARASRCLHAWYLECFGDPTWRSPPDAGTRLKWDGGVEHERRAVSALNYVEPEWDGHDWDAGVRATLAQMEAGTPWIYQAVLEGRDARAT